MQQPKIVVAIRKRPLSKKEEAKGDSDIISVKTQQTLIVSEYKQKVDLTKYLQETQFNFDFAFSEHSTNQEIYESAVRPLVDSAFQGAKVTCFAYGQTGSGKTHTMNGQPTQGIPGLYTLGAQDIFSYLSDSRYSHLSARLSFFEIYCGKLFDLLNKRAQLKIREDNKSNINIIGLEETVIDSWEQFIELLNYGAAQRVTSQNSANADSSRSHAILQITLKEGKKVFGKISFIDLAGNQRGADHMDMNKQTRIDGAQINKSLLSLKECIRALDQGKGHTPFRGSKLTMVLKDSFVGFCRTLMIGNVSPSSASSQNTLNTLRYADRVKQLRRPQDNTFTKEEMKAKELMLPRQNKNVIKIDIEREDDMDDINKKREDAQRNYGLFRQDNNINQQEVNNYNRKGQSFNNNYVQPLSFGNNNNNSNNLQNPKFTSNQNNSVNQTVKTSFQQQMQPNQYQNQQYQPIQQNKNIPNNINNLAKSNVANTKKTPNIYQNQRGNQVPNQLNKVQTYPTNKMQLQESVPHHLQRVNSYQLPNDRLYEFNSNKTGQTIQRSNNNIQYPNQVNPISTTQRPISNYGKNFGQQPPYQQQYQNQPYQQQYQQNQQRGKQPNDRFANGQLRFGGNQQKFDSKAGERSSHRSSNVNNMGEKLPRNNKQYEIPQNWDEAIQMFQTNSDAGLLIRLQQSFGQNLLIEETSLMEKHSNTLRNQIDIIKKQMNLISQLQVNRNIISTREYVSFLQENIEQKLSSLQFLRQNLAQFTYKLDQLEQIEEKVKGKVGTHWEDEQLLDDLS